MVSRMAATRAIHLQTAVPGPRSRAIVERKERVIAKPMSLYLPIVAAEGRGSTLTDVDGNTYIDFTGGGGCPHHCHTPPHVAVGGHAPALAPDTHPSPHITNTSRESHLHHP